MGLSAIESLDAQSVPSLEILVADDDQLSQRLMNVLLTREGHRVETASNGLEALEAVKRKKYVHRLIFHLLRNGSAPGAKGEAKPDSC